MSKTERSEIIKLMEERKAHLEKEFEKIPFAQAFHNKMWRFNADIDQLGYRINYLNKFDQELQGKEQPTTPNPKK